MKRIRRILRWYFPILLLTGILYFPTEGENPISIVKSQELVKKSEKLISANVDDYWVINSRYQNRTNLETELIIKKGQLLETYYGDMKFSLENINRGGDILDGVLIGVDTFMLKDSTLIQNLIIKNLTESGFILTQLSMNEDLLTSSNKINIKGQFLDLESFYWKNNYHYYISLLNESANNENKYLTLYWNPSSNQSIYFDGYLHDYYKLENPIILLSNYPNEDSYKSSFMNKELNIVQIYTYQNQSYSNILYTNTFSTLAKVRLISLVELKDYIFLFSSKLINNIRQLDITTFRRSSTHLINVTTWKTNSEFDMNIGKVVYLKENVNLYQSIQDHMIHLVVLGSLERYYLQNNNTIKLQYSIIFNLEISIEESVITTSNFISDIPYGDNYVEVINNEGKSRYDILNEKITYNDNGTEIKSIYVIEFVSNGRVKSRVNEIFIVFMVISIYAVVIGFIYDNRNKISMILSCRFKKS